MAFSKEAKDFGDRIIHDIKDQFKVTLGRTEWMSKDVQKLGIKKVDNIVQKIGYPTASPDIMNPEKLKHYYSGLVITNSTFFENNLNSAKFEIKREWSKLGKPTDRDEWGMTASTVNAYYNPAGNEIVFPAGIMQAPLFYDPSVPQYLSYGAFGAVSGHELSHGRSLHHPGKLGVLR
jgi:endothelin-converting enzyme